MLSDKEITRLGQALGPSLEVLHPNRKHHSIQPRSREDPGPIETAHWT